MDDDDDEMIVKNTLISKIVHRVTSQISISESQDDSSNIHDIVIFQTTSPQNGRNSKKKNVKNKLNY